jgi:hypothetical protein
MDVISHNQKLRTISLDTVRLPLIDCAGSGSGLMDSSGY